MPVDREELRRTEERLALAQAVAHIGSWELDLQTGVMWGSDEAFRIYGIARTPDNCLPAATPRAAALPEYHPLLTSALEGLVERDAPYDLEFTLRRPEDGTLRTVHSMAVVVRDAERRPLLVIGTIHDITHAKRAEDALRAALASAEAANQALQVSESRSHMLFEHAADAILLGDARGVIVGTNARAVELTGFHRDALIGQNIAVLFSGDERARVPLRYDLLNDGEVVVRERLLDRPDGRRVYVEMRTKRLPDGTYQAILRDLTERRRLEEELVLRQRMDSLGTLASGIAHDFNNILAAIMGYAGMLELEADRLAPDQRDCVANILQASSRAGDLIRRLQATTRSEPVQAAPFEVGAVATEVFKVLSETTDRIVSKVLEPSGEPLHVVGTPSDLYHVLLNLGINAVQAIEAREDGQGGEVCVHWASQLITTPTPGGPPPGDYVHIEVRDTGIGMSDEVRRHAFDPLFTTKAKGTRKGQGLGLTMVYRTIVDRYRGHVTLDSRPGHGATVSLHLPRARGAVLTATDAQGPARDDHTRGHETLLVVDDEPQVLALQARMLSARGHEVLVARDGEEALSVYDGANGRVALVVLDRTLPRRSGAEVFRELRRRNPELPVIVSSGDLGDAVDEFAGAQHFLAKPFPPTALVSAVRRILDQR